MQSMATFDTPSTFAVSSARIAAASALAAALLLMSLHALSPEFDPSWRMVSEYANGRFPWVLSLMFMAWGLSSWTLAGALWSRVESGGGRIGLWLLLASGMGEAMAAIFDVNQHPMHEISGAIGVLPMPVAAILITLSLCRTQPWEGARKKLVLSAHLIWISIVLLAATMAIFVITLHQAGGHMGAHLQQLPSGVIALDGWANRMYVLSSCWWTYLMARLAA